MIHSAFSTGAVAAFFQVVMIDLPLAGDNAVAVGVAAAGLPRSIRRRAIVLGLGAAVAMLIGFALVAVQLLKIVGLLFAGGAILLWVCWRTWRDLRSEDVAVAVDENGETSGRRPKTLLVALFEILAADLSMSLDNVLGVAGAARAHPQVLVFGLILSITVTGGRRLDRQAARTRAMASLPGVGDRALRRPVDDVAGHARRDQAHLADKI